MEILTKTCTKCKTEKLTTEFHKKKDTKDGLTLKCKLCIKKYNTENKDKINKRRREKHKENPNKMKIQNKINYERHKKSRLIKNKEYCEKHKDRLKKYRAKYYSSEKGKLVKINHRHKRRSLLKNGDVTTEQLKNLYNTSKNCYWCGVKLFKENTHLDHLMPFKLGGKHTISNLVLACCSCNLKKQGKDPLEFAKTLDESI